MAIRPGNLSGDETHYEAYVGSMAAEIERELSDLLAVDGLPRLPGDPDEAHPADDDRELRDRRRLFVAIARAVVRHLNDNQDAITITLPDVAATELHPTFDIDWN